MTELPLPGRRAALRRGAWLLCLLSVGGLGWAQQAAGPATSPAALPDAPDTAESSSAQTAPGGQSAQPSPAASPADERAPQTKRILGFIPNFRAVSTDQTLPPQTVKEKFRTATDDSFDYSAVFIPAALAGYSLARNSTPEFGKGGVGYGRYLWHAAVDQTSENYFVEFIVPAVTHEDTRFYTLSRGSFMKRAGYAMSRVVVTRSDSGRSVFNLSEVVGSGASAGLSSLYYPTRERSLGNTGSQWGLDVGIDALSFMAREFWPDVNRRLFRQHAAADAQ